MSDEQIKQILKRLDAQDAASEARTEEQYKTFLIIRNDISNLQREMEPIHALFDSVSGFNKISVWILKGLVLLGAGIGVVYGFIKYLKN